MGSQRKGRFMKLAYLKNYWDKYQEKMQLNVDPLLNPSILISGESGSGKSHALKWMLRNLLESQAVDLYFCNFKDSLDFRFLQPYPKYYVGKGCEQGFQAFYDRFCGIQTQEGEAIPYMTLLVFDEFPAFMLRTQNEDKKKADRYSRMLADVLMFFRSYKGGCWIVCQRSDSQYFANGSRDNFHGRILLTRGRPSKESLNMLGFVKEDLQADTYGVGEGICYIDGKGLFEIKYPLYDAEKLERDILKLLARPPSGKPEA